MALSPVTIYCCGTAYGRDHHDVIARLNRNTLSHRLILDGPGSHAKAEDNPGGASLLSGRLFGAGVDANVDAAVAFVAQAVMAQGRRGAVAARGEARDGDRGGGLVNLCGWSRGAVTCFKIANALARTPGLAQVRCRIFAIDPVPGQWPDGHNPMWKDVGTAANVVRCRTILALHDRRSAFAPLYPDINGPNVEVEVMPGDHSAIVEGHAGREDAYRLVHHMAKAFLQTFGTQFGDRTLLSDDEVLACYARIKVNFDDYAEPPPGLLFRILEFNPQTRSGLGKVSRGRPVPANPVDRRPAFQLAGRPMGFWINEHHRDICRRAYPWVSSEIDRPADTAFQLSRAPQWGAEWQRMYRQVPVHAQIVEHYHFHAVAPVQPQPT